MSDAQKWNFVVAQFMKHGYSESEAEKRADSVMKSYVASRERGAFSSALATAETYAEYERQVKAGKIVDTGMNLGLKKENGKIVIRDMPTQEKIWGEPLKKYGLPSLPTMPSFETPSGGDIKRSLQVTGLVLIGVILLIVYMLTGKGDRGI